MFVKTIKLEDVRREDVVDTVLGPRKIAGVSDVRDPYVELFMEGGGSIKDWPSKEIRLLHRPRPDGLLKAIADELERTRQDLDEARRCGDGILIADIEAAIGRLLPLMQAYELGKPLERAPKVAGGAGQGQVCQAG